MLARISIAFLASVLLLAGGLSASTPTEPDRIKVVWKDGHRGEISELELRRYTLFSERPEYPREARRSKIAGVGVYLLHLDKSSGAVTRVEIATSTGSKWLDTCATTAFSKWRFKPGVLLEVRMPSYFRARIPENPWVFD
jgi:TonB family protein